MRTRRVGLVVVISCFVMIPLAAQDKLPKRPRLAELADTNDPVAYYDHGMAVLERDPRQAADAFYWATRLNPGWAEALYARRVAGFMDDERLLIRYLNGDWSAISSRGAQRLDSLEYRAQMINPFFLRDLERPFFAKWVRALINDMQRKSGGRPISESESVELDYYIEGIMRTGTSFRSRARLAAGQRRFEEALNLYQRALSESRDKPGIRWERARILYGMGGYDSALVELEAAITELRERDAGRTRMWYQSKEFFEHAAAMIHEQRGDAAAAREAYGRALLEHLSYYPAHLRLGMLALARGDTAVARSELDLAAQVAPDEAIVRVTYGALLAQLGRIEDAEPHLRRAAELEPYYALPQYLLGRVAEMRQQREAATTAYRAFLSLAARRDARRAEVTQLLAELGP
jgi:tetratricopeptide (TPR) repeat protein